MKGYDWWLRQGRGIADRALQAVYALSGLFGILTVCSLIVVILYLLSYEAPDLMLLLHAQNTVFSFLLTALTVIVMLKTLFLSKRLVWWVWGTQTPDFEASENDRVGTSEDLAKTARRKGVRWTRRGLFFGYLFPLLGIYVDPFMETVFVRNYPETPILEKIVDFISGLPLFSELDFVTTFLSIVHPFEAVVVGSVVVPLTLGLWNLGYVFANNDVFREQVRKDPIQGISL